MKRLDAALQRLVDERQLAGLVTMAMRHGKLIHSGAFGLREIESGSPMTKDTLFRIYSMTKPITSVAMMMLHEEGRWSPQDPIGKHVPELANLKVFKGVDALGRILVEDASHAPTMRELMTHTAGFSYGAFDTPIDRLYKDSRGRNAILHASSWAEMIERIASIPLLHQPGTRWTYSISSDIQGYLVEKLSGQPFSRFLKERLFEPLGMTDTGFHVSVEKRDRLACFYVQCEGGALTPFTPESGAFCPSCEQEPPLPLGGAGLFSTAADYSRFAQMLLNGGELDGIRILSPATVKMMSANHLSSALIANDASGAMRPGLGYGYNLGVITDPALADSTTGAGTFHWGGAGGTWFWVDPSEGVVFVGMTQKWLGDPDCTKFAAISQQTFYQALKYGVMPWRTD